MPTLVKNATHEDLISELTELGYRAQACQWGLGTDIEVNITAPERLNIVGMHDKFAIFMIAESNFRDYQVHIASFNTFETVTKELLSRFPPGLQCALCSKLMPSAGEVCGEDICAECYRKESIY